MYCTELARAVVERRLAAVATLAGVEPVRRASRRARSRRSDRRGGDAVLRAPSTARCSHVSALAPSAQAARADDLAGAPAGRQVVAAGAGHVGLPSASNSISCQVAILLRVAVAREDLDQALALRVVLSRRRAACPSASPAACRSPRSCRAESRARRSPTRRACGTGPAGVAARSRQSAGRSRTWTPVGRRAARPSVSAKKRAKSEHAAARAAEREQPSRSAARRRARAPRRRRRRALIGRVGISSRRRGRAGPRSCGRSGSRASCRPASTPSRGRRPCRGSRGSPATALHCADRVDRLAASAAA